MAVGTGAAILGSAALGIGGAALSKPKAGKDPYAALRPYQNQAAQYASQLYQQGGPQVYGGSTVAPLSGTTQSALQQQISRAQSGSPLVGQAQNFVSQGLNQPVQSGYGDAQNPYAQSVATNAQNPYGGASNPFLDATYNKALQSAMQGVESQFARGGRNIGAARPVAGDIASNLATSLYGGAYESERNRQLSFDQQQQGLTSQANLAAQGIGAQGFENAQGRQLSDINAQRQQQMGFLGAIPGLANQDYMDIGQLRDAGSVYDQYGQAQLSDQVSQFNQQQQRPQQNLDALIARLGGLSGGTGQMPQQPPGTDYLSAGLGGALLGSQLFRNTGFMGSQPYAYNWSGPTTGGLA